MLQNAQEHTPTAEEAAFMTEVAKAQTKFDEAMDDDLNTADALGALFELVREVHRLPQSGVSRAAVERGQAAMLRMTGILGLLMKQTDEISPEVQAMVEERALARKNKDWKRSDELRDAIKAAGYVLEDTSAGQKVRKSV